MGRPVTLKDPNKRVTREELFRILNVYHAQNHTPWYRRLLRWCRSLMRS